MSQDRIKIPRTSDKILAGVFKKLVEKFAFHSVTVIGISNVQIGQIDLAADAEGAWKELLKLDSCLIDQLHATKANLTVAYHRGGQYQPEARSSIYDEVIFHFNDNQASPTPQERLEIVAFISEKLKRFEIGRITTDGVSPEINQVLAIHQSNLERLERLNEDLISKSSDFRSDLERKFDEKVHLYEEKLQKRQTDADAKMEVKSQELGAREEAIEKKLAAIDDRNNTHARREIRDRMLDDVKKRIQNFGVSKATEKKRVPVALGMVTLCALIVISVGLTLLELFRAEQVMMISKTDFTHVYWLWARLAILSLSLVGTVIYYIKWVNKWAEQHAASEFQLQQFYIDVNRANWVIESCLEWRKETDSAIPAELLSSITNNLFVSPMGEPEQVIHPADELASALMGSASKLKVKVGDGELEFDKPKRITKKASIRK
jgi:hypothetical protein